MGQADDPGRGRHSASPALPAGPAAVPGEASTAVGSGPEPGRHRARGGLDRFRAVGRRPRAALTLLVVALVVVVAAVVAVTTSPHGADTEPHSADEPTATSADDLAGWVEAELPPGATLSAEPALAAELAESGLAVGTLATAASTTADPAAPVLQVLRGADPDGRTVVARFADPDGDELTVVDPAAGPPDEADLTQRRRLGAALLANPATAAPAEVAQRLRDGEVDPRLLTLLAGMAARFGIQLAELPSVAGEPASAAARAAVVSSVDGRPVAEGTAELTELKSYLAAQLDTFSPDELELVDGGLLLHFRYRTDPDGALSTGGG